MQGYTEDVAEEGRDAYHEAQGTRLAELEAANLIEGGLAVSLRQETDVELGHYRRAVEEALADDEAREDFGEALLNELLEAIAEEELRRAHTVHLRRAEVGERVIYGAREYEVEERGLIGKDQPGGPDTRILLAPLQDGRKTDSVYGRVAVVFYD